MHREDLVGLTGQMAAPLFIVPAQTSPDPDATRLPAVLVPSDLRISPQWRDALAGAFHHVSHQSSIPNVLQGLQTDLTAVALVPLPPLVPDRECEALYKSPVTVRKRIVAILDDFSPRSLRIATEAGTGDYASLASDPKEIAWRLRLRLIDFLARDVVAPSESNSIWGPATQGSTALSPKEHRLYAYLVRNFGHPVSRAEALRAIWERDPNATAPSNIVDVYIRYLRLKLRDLAPHLEIATVRCVGYVLRQRDIGEEEQGPGRDHPSRRRSPNSHHAP